AHRDGRRTPLVDRRPDLPLPFVQVVERALAVDPQQRFPSAGALLEALGAVDGSTRLRLRFLVNIGVAAVGAIVGFILLGMLSSRAFNASLGRSEFAEESVSDWLSWGARSCLGPGILLLLAFASLGLLVAGRRVLVAMSASARRWDAAARLRISAAARRLRLDEPTVLASCVLLLTASALLGSWWHFSPLVAALFSDLSTAPAATLRRLAPVVDGSLNLQNNSF